jgi:hypothetical protein
MEIVDPVVSSKKTDVVDGVSYVQAGVLVRLVQQDGILYCV